MGALFGFGVFVFVIYLGTLQAIYKVINDIKAAERALWLPSTVLAKHGPMDWGYCLLIVLTAGSAAFFALVKCLGFCQAGIWATAIVLAGLGIFWCSRFAIKE